MKNKKSILMAAGFILLAALLAAAYFFVLKPAASPGSKTIAVTVVKSETDSMSVDIHTDAEFLRQALEESNLVQGVEYPGLGLMLTTVDGKSADDSKGEFWSLRQDGEDLFTGVDSTPIEDGDTFEIVLTTW